MYCLLWRLLLLLAFSLPIAACDGVVADAEVIDARVVEDVLVGADASRVDAGSPDAAPDAAEQIETACTNGVDDDGDGGSDCDDADCAAEPACVPATLFVSTEGSDDNDGSAGMPFATIGAAIAEAEMGDVIEVAAGVYRELVVIDRSGLVIRGGGQAIIDGADPLEPWRDEGVVDRARCRLWSTPFDPSQHPGLIFVDGTQRTPTQLFIDGDTRLQTLPMPESFANGHALSLAATQDAGRIADQLAPGTWYWLDETHGEDGNRVFVCLDEADSANDRLIEMPVRSVGFYSQADQIYLHGFEVRRQAAAGIGLLGGAGSADISVIGNRVSLISGHRSVTPGDRAGRFTWGEGVGIMVRVSERGVVRDNTVTDVAYTGIKLSRARSDAPLDGVIAGNTVARIEPHPFGVGNAHERGQGIVIGRCARGNVVEDNAISWVHNGIWFDSAFGADCGISDTVVQRNTITDVGNGIHFERATDRCTARRNLVARADKCIKLGSALQLDQEPNPASPIYPSRSPTIVNNTLVDCRIGVLLGYTTTPVLKNNLITGSGEAGLVVSEATIAVTDELAIDFNLYDPSTACVGSWGSGRGCTLDAWREVSGGDLSSLRAPAGLTAPDAGDYSLGEGSPAIDAGTDVGLDGDCGPPDIGAFERCL